MASIIEGYNYDIFISYRQKDNKHDGWVTEFVNNLKDELESTFKEEIGVYFDINPHDGLLETYDVDESLKDKLKCLIFIPIISRTYCDPKSFAWEHEFKAFVEMASKDNFGLKVKLANGNVASRMLPVRIHELDKEDIKTCESVLGSVLRGIEFIYKEPGIDKPLDANDDEKKNLNNTKYSLQIVKMAHSIKDIISAVKNKEQNSEMKPADIPATSKIPIKSSRIRLFISLLLSLILIIAVFLLAPKLIRTEEHAAKSIAVLPFANMSNDPAQDYFGDGIMLEIMNNLYMIGGLDISPSTSSVRFKDSRPGIKEIARRLNVNYLLEGFVSKSEKHIRISVRLINGRTEKILWSKKYDFDTTDTDLLNLQSDVAQKVAKNMNMVLQASLKERISYLPTKNTEAYDLFLQANKLNYSLPAKVLLEKAIELDDTFSDAYAELAFYYIWRGGHGGSMTSEDVLDNAEPLLKRALDINNNCATAHQALATLNLLYKWDFTTVEKELKIVQELNPSSPNEGSVDFLLATGKFSEGLNIGKNLEKKYYDIPLYWTEMALAYCFDSQVENAISSLKKAWEIEGYTDFLHLNTVRIYNNMEMYNEAIEIYDKYYRKENSHFDIPYYWGHIGIAAFKTGNKYRSDTCLKKLLVRSESTAIGSPCFFTAALYTAMGENDKAIGMLENAYNNREVEMYWVKSEPLFRPLHGDPRYGKLLDIIGF